MSEDKKYDSHDEYRNRNARLTKDAEVFPSKIPGKPPLVRLTFVSESRQEKSKPLWVEAKIRDFDANLAQYLKKGDTLPVEGKPVLETYGEGKTAFKLDRAAIFPSIELFMKLKERGFTPGAGGAAGGKPSGGARRGRGKPVDVQDVDFGDETE